MTTTPTIDVIRLQGSVGVSGAFELKDRLAELTAVARPQITVDLQQVDHLHLSVVNCLILAAVASEANAGSFSIVAGDGPARQLLDLAGLGGWIQ